MALKTVIIDGAKVQLHEGVINWLLKLHKANEEKQKRALEAWMKALEDIDWRL